MQHDQHDALKHSTANTRQREALALWERCKETHRSALFGQFSRLAAESEKAMEIGRALYRVAASMADVLDSIHWPKYDNAASRMTDERGHELAARHLADGHAEFAWGVLANAYRHACDHAADKLDRPLGIDLSGYFRAEAEAVLAVLRRHYLRQD